MKPPVHAQPRSTCFEVAPMAGYVRGEQFIRCIAQERPGCSLLWAAARESQISPLSHCSPRRAPLRCRGYATTAWCIERCHGYDCSDRRPAFTRPARQFREQITRGSVAMHHGGDLVASPRRGAHSMDCASVIDRHTDKAVTAHAACHWHAHAHVRSVGVIAEPGGSHLEYHPGPGTVERARRFEAFGSVLGAGSRPANAAAHGNGRCRRGLQLRRLPSGLRGRQHGSRIGRGRHWNGLLLRLVAASALRLVPFMEEAVGVVLVHEVALRIRKREEQRERGGGGGEAGKGRRSKWWAWGTTGESYVGGPAHMRAASM